MKNGVKWCLFASAFAAAMALPAHAQGQIPAEATARKAYVANLIATVQKADAQLIDRFAACRELAMVGDASAVPVLAALLTDEKMSHMARYGLEPNPDPAVDEALRAALNQVKGNLLVGVIDSIGIRRDAKAVDALAALLSSADAAVVSATACSLGRIGTAESGAALGKALESVSGESLVAVADGCMRAADAMCSAGKRDLAAGMYDRVRSSKAPQHVRMAATRGAFLARGKDAIPEIIKQLVGEDGGMAAAALRVTYEMNAPELTQALAAELPKLPAGRQGPVLQALGNRKDASAVPAILALTQTGPTDARVAAVRAACQIGCPSCLPAIAGLSQCGDAEVAAAAQAGLAGFAGKEGDAAVVQLMDSPDPKIQCMAIDLAGQRRMPEAMPALLKAAESANKPVSVASFKVLGELGDVSEIPALVNLLMKAPSGAAESALSSVCIRQSEQPARATACVDTICGALSQAPVPAKQSLLRVLRAIGGPKALTTVTAVMKDGSAEVKDAATRALCDWTTADAAGEQLALAKTSTNPTYQVLALRGYIHSIGDPNLAPAQRQAMCKEATGLIQRDPEKKLLLAALGNADDAESLATVMTYLANSATKEEACAAAVAIGERLVVKNPPAVVEPMKTVVKSTQNPGILRRAHRVFALTRPKPAAAPAAK